MSMPALTENREAERAEADGCGLTAHCHRVASLALEIGDRLRLSVVDQQVLEQAALLHHTPLKLLEPGTLDRLMRDVAGPDWQMPPAGQIPGQTPGATTPAQQPGDRDLEQVLEREVRRVLVIPHHRGQQDPADTTAVLAQIIELCDFFDQRLEYLPYEAKANDRMLVEFSWMVNDGLYHRDLVSAFVSLRQIRREDMADTVQRLPVYPAVALQLLTLPLDDGSTTGGLKKVASADQTLAGCVLKAANSALYSPARRISDIGHAVSYIGVEAARRVMTAVALGPLYASAALRDLWKHSLEVAELAEHLASVSAVADSKEAFLAGLVHDVGRLAIQRLPAALNRTHMSLLKRGCPPVFVEMALCGFDHGEAGSECLRSWVFPEQLVVAVEYHHRPEQTDTALASILYLAEHWSASDEDLPSLARLHHATEAIGITMESLQELGKKQSGALITMLDVA